MHIYPQLTIAEQSNLPKLISAPKAMVSKFEDSTHQLWHCETVDGPMVIKLCDHAAIAKSSFWDGMNYLFGADFPNSLDQIAKTHDLLTEEGSFTVPDFVAAKANRFVLTRFLPGKDVESAIVTDDMVIILAKHIAQLHQHQSPVWGSIYAPEYALSDWGEQLKITLLKLTENYNVTVPEQQMRDVLAQTEAIKEETFVPIMLDLRWDQFRELNHTQKNHALALIDLDAFAIGPRSLELLLLEYILTASQFTLFKQHYIAIHSWPDYSQQKPCYQLLLFLMNVLGETDLDRWMRQV